MQAKINLQYNGQSLLQSDINTLAISAASADDAALQEMLRLPPVAGGLATKGVQPGGANVVTPSTGGVFLENAKVYIGSRTSYQYQIRSQDYSRTFIPLANATANICVALIYLQVTLDASAGLVTRKVKDPTSKVVTAANVNPIFVNSVVPVVIQSNAISGGHPLLPGMSGSGSLGMPNDADPVFYVPIAYVVMPVGAGVGTVYTTASVAEVAQRLGSRDSLNVAQANSGAVVIAGDPSVPLAATGLAGGIAPYFWTPGSSWTARAVAYVSPVMCGGGQFMFAADLTTGSTSIISGQIIDAREDYRNRFFRVTAYTLQGGATAVFPWNIPFSNNTAPTVPARGAPASMALGTDSAMWTSHSMCDSGSGFAVIAHASSATMSNIGGGGTKTIDLYVDASTGTMKCQFANAPNALIFFWIEYSGQMGNR